MSDGTLPNDAYGHTVSMSTDGTTDTYLVGGSTSYEFPAGTDQGVVYLSIAKQWNLQMFMVALQSYIQGSFPVATQLQFVCMYLAAQAGGLTNRATYIAQLLTWLNVVEAYAATYVTGIQGLSDPSVVAATIINTTLITAAPSVTLLGAISIPN